tara:strand:- start:79 stop:300 length:222 start_codon:yes stop_codon:yes gene_type:complete
MALMYYVYRLKTKRSKYSMIPDYGYYDLDNVLQIQDDVSLLDRGKEIQTSYGTLGTSLNEDESSDGGTEKGTQ